jgi:hypothetical protein
VVNLDLIAKTSFLLCAPLWQLGGVKLGLLPPNRASRYNEGSTRGKLGVTHMVVGMMVGKYYSHCDGQ